MPHFETETQSQKPVENDKRRELVPLEDDPVWRFYADHGNGD